MNAFDWFVLLGTMIGIAAYGAWRTRHTDNLNTYLKGSASTRWGTIGISVMATQASTITYLSLPGQAYENGIAFIQNYFGLPLALILVCAVFLPIYRKLGVYTAYEYLGKRFDQKTRLLGASLFLLQRGLQAGITIYAPSIILATVLHWRLDLTIIFTGTLAIVYTVTGGSAAVNLTQKWQMAVIFGGMVTAFIVLLVKLPPDATHIAGAMGKLQAVDYTPDLKLRYTLWSGLLGGFFLSLSYFGTDQSQVQRYIGGRSTGESRIGLLFNGLLKVPMQYFILFVGVMVFVLYQFTAPPVFFNKAEVASVLASGKAPAYQALEVRQDALFREKRAETFGLIRAMRAGDEGETDRRQARMLALQDSLKTVRKEAVGVLKSHNP